MPSAEPLAFDKRLLRARFNRAAATYDAAAVLERTVGDQLIERLDVVKLVPARVLDAGCGTGYCTRRLTRRYRRAEIIGLDLAPGMIAQARRRAGWFSRSRFVNGDVERLPFADGSFDLVLSNLALPWADPSLVFIEFLRVLRPDGLLAFTTFGPDTLQELRTAWRAIDAAAHVHALLDMHDIGDALVRAGFADPVMDVERYVLTYGNPAAAMQDLTARGQRNLDRSRSRGLTGRTRFERFKSAYAAIARDRRVPLTYEVVYGHAWAPAVRRSRDGAVRIPIDQIGRRR